MNLKGNIINYCLNNNLLTRISFNIICISDRCLPTLSRHWLKQRGHSVHHIKRNTARMPRKIKKSSLPPEFLTEDLRQWIFFRNSVSWLEEGVFRSFSSPFHSEILSSIFSYTKNAYKQHI
jgi:hypothetical protein